MSQNKCSNNNNDIEIHKLAKNRFPSKDKIKPRSDKTEYSQIRILENILNLSICKLNPSNYRFWSELAQRDVRFKEIS